MCQIVSSILSIDFITSSITLEKRILGVVFFSCIFRVFSCIFQGFNNTPPACRAAPQPQNFHLFLLYANNEVLFVVKCLRNNILKLLQYLLVFELVGN